jgi:hypothetical protein
VDRFLDRPGFRGIFGWFLKDLGLSFGLIRKIGASKTKYSWTPGSAGQMGAGKQRVAVSTTRK